MDQSRSLGSNSVGFCYTTYPTLFELVRYYWAARAILLLFRQGVNRYLAGGILLILLFVLTASPCVSNYYHAPEHEALFPRNNQRPVGPPTTTTRSPSLQCCIASQIAVNYTRSARLRSGAAGITSAKHDDDRRSASTCP